MSYQDLGFERDKESPEEFDQGIGEEKKPLFDIVLPEDFVTTILNFIKEMGYFLAVAPNVWQLLH